MKIALLKAYPVKKEKHPQMIIEVALKRGHEARIIYIVDLVFESGKEFQIHARDCDLLSFDALLIRTTSEYFIARHLFAKYFLDKRKIVVDEVLGRDRVLTDKVAASYYLAKNGLSTLRTYQIYSRENLEVFASKLGYPLVMKNILKHRGESVHKIDKFEEAVKIFKTSEIPGEFVVQEFVETNFDLRILVVGDKVLGAMKRVAPEGDFRSNIAVGGRGERFESSKKLKDLALAAKKAVGFEVFGVDIIFDGNKPYVLEINRAPQFKGFMEATGINVAEEIIKYLEEKATRQK